MILYHISTVERSGSFAGGGSSFVSGRWHDAGDMCIYGCLSKSQTLVEYAYGDNPFDPAISELDLVFTVFEVPDRSLKEFFEVDLPSDWRTWPRPVSAMAFGSEALKLTGTLLISYPSVVYPDERIYVINVRHPLMKVVKVLGVQKAYPSKLI